MVATLICLLALPTGTSRLHDLSQALRGGPAWTASFEQRYVPAGFDEGSVDTGTVLISAPNRLRFEYAGDVRRVFAFDGAVARLVDPGAATCDAVRLDAAARGSLPLAVLADPDRQDELFAERLEGPVLVLTPHRPDPDLAEVRIEVGEEGLPRRFTVIDGAGNRNEFSFSRWRRAQVPAGEAFSPALPGQPPCEPPDA